MRRPIVSRLRSEWATLVVAVLLFAAVTAARFVTSDVGTAVGFLYAIPISLVAVRFGGRAGIAAGLVACALLPWWAEIHAAQLTFVGYATRTVVLVGVGGLVGVLVERRARAQAEATRWFSMSNDLLCCASLEGFFTAVNPTWTTCLGYSEDELVERPYIELVHPDDVEATVEQTAALAAARTSSSTSRTAMDDFPPGWKDW